jgi:hypothetical protein
MAAAGGPFYTFHFQAQPITENDDDNLRSRCEATFGTGDFLAILGLEQEKNPTAEEGEYGVRAYSVPICHSSFITPCPWTV